MDFSTNDLVELVKAAGDSGVKHLKWKDLEITYDMDYVPQKVVDLPTEPVNNDNGVQDLENEVTKLEIDLADLHITDPEEFERLEAGGEI